MSEVGFYHLKGWTLERALPRLLERALAEGHRVVVMTGSEERAAALDGHLWTYSEASFLPHGRARRQPSRQDVLAQVVQHQVHGGSAHELAVAGGRIGGVHRCST